MLMMNSHVFFSAALHLGLKRAGRNTLWAGELAVARAEIRSGFLPVISTGFQSKDSLKTLKDNQEEGSI